MLGSQRQKLTEHTGKYLSIGITEDGAPRRSVWVPWHSTGNAFNMRTPQIYLAPADLTDEA
ncbi:MAG: hypothetical protein IJE58_06740, partial [Oscillospiraceae bacterium]|nr:hypothetical protein [Oscillospiraceae bacterium]